MGLEDLETDSLKAQSNMLLHVQEIVSHSYI